MTQTTPVLWLATPCYGGEVHANYARSLLALKDACVARGVRLHTELGGGEALIGRGRATMMAAFLASPATHLLFVDADVGFPPEAVFRLLELEKQVIGGVYPKRAQAPGGPLALEVDLLVGEEEAPVRRVAAVGAGFLMIRRAAAERIGAGYPQLRARLGDVHGSRAAEAAMVFDTLIDPDTGEYLADHQAFCRRWRDLGGEVWAAFDLGLTHIGVAELTAP